jgi:hypothetical protein
MGKERKKSTDKAQQIGITNKNQEDPISKWVLIISSHKSKQVDISRVSMLLNCTGVIA